MKNLDDLSSFPEAEYPDHRAFANAIKEYASVNPDLAGDAKVIKVSLNAPSFSKEIVSIATNIWRIRSRVYDSVSNEPKEVLTKDDVKKVARYLDDIYSLLGTMGIEVKDRVGENFDYGLPEKVVSALPQEGLTKERVIKTLLPTIYWNNQIAQQGEIDIATPIKKD